eukprot:354680-Amphidinium_carterae.1
MGWRSVGFESLGCWAVCVVRMPRMLGKVRHCKCSLHLRLQYHIQAPAAKGLALSCCRTCCFGMSVLAAFISCCALPLMFYNLHPFAACFGCVLLAALFFPYARDLWGRLTDDMNYGEVPPDCKCANIAMLWGIAAVCVTAILALRY